MSFSESIIVRLGLDKAKFEHGLHGAEHLVHKFNHALEFVGLGLGIHWAKEFVSGLAEMAGEIKATSEALNIGTDFLQAWRHGAELTEVGAETATRALEKFTQKIGEAAQGGKDGAQMAKTFQRIGVSLKDANGVTKDTETLLGEVADRFKAMQDPAERANIAVDLFGKTGARLIPMLKEGSEGLQKLKDDTLKLTEAELENLDAFDKFEKSFVQKSKVIGGEVVSYWTGIVKNIGAAWKEFSVADRLKGGKSLQEIAEHLADEEEDEARRAREQQKKLEKKLAIKAAEKKQQEDINAAMEAAQKAQTKTEFELMSADEKLNVLLEFRKSLMDDIARDPKASVENGKRAVAVAKASLDIAKEQKEVEREKQQTLEKKARALERQTEAQKRLTQATQAQGDAHHDRSAMGLDDVADRTPLTLAGFWNKRRAQEIRGAEARARIARAEGRGDIADKLTDYAAKLREGFDALSKAEQDPLKSVAENTREAADALAKIQKDGLAVKNGE